MLPSDMALFQAARIHVPWSAIGRRKNLEKPKSTPQPLQPLEIPQNRQRNVWKSLEKKGLDLEMLGEKAWRFGAPPTQAQGRASRINYDKIESLLELAPTEAAS